MLSRSKRPFSRFEHRHFLHQKADPKGVLKSRSTKLGKNCVNIILKCCVSLIIQVLSMFSAQFLVLSRFSYCFGEIPDYFWTWTDKIHISKFSRLCWEPWSKSPLSFSPVSESPLFPTPGGGNLYIKCQNCPWV